MQLNRFLFFLACLLVAGCRPAPPVVYETVDELRDGMGRDNVPLAANESTESEVSLRIEGVARVFENGWPRHYCGVRLINPTGLPISYRNSRWQVQESVNGKWVDKPIMWRCGVELMYFDFDELLPNHSSVLVLETDSFLLRPLPRVECLSDEQIETQRVFREKMAELFAENGDLDAAARYLDPNLPVRVGIEYSIQESERKVAWSQKIDFDELNLPSESD